MGKSYRFDAGVDRHDRTIRHASTDRQRKLSRQAKRNALEATESFIKALSMPDGMPPMLTRRT